MSAHSASASAYRRPPETDSGVLVKVVALFLGLLVGVLGVFALLMWADAHEAKTAADRAAAKAGAAAAPASHESMHAHATAAGLESYAGAAPANADALAKAHRPFPAALPAAPAGPVANVTSS
jgi:hypothetical protein